MNHSLPYDPDNVKRKELAQVPFSDEWFRRIKDNAKGRAKRDGHLFTLKASDVKQIFESSNFSCYACNRPDDELPARLSLVRLDPAQGYTPENTKTFCRACEIRKNYTPPKKKPRPPQQPKTSLWRNAPVKRITYHAAARYYQRFEYRELSEGEIDNAMFWRATRAIQKISTVWTKVGPRRYEFENAVFIVDNAGSKVITIFPKRQPRTGRIRRSAAYYQARKDPYV